MNKDSALFKWLWLVSCFSPSNKRLWDVLGQCGDSVDSAFAALNDKTSYLKYISSNEAKNAASVHDEQIFALIDYCAEHDIGVVCFSDDDYPERLKTIYNPPAVLFYRGDISCLERELVLTVVGTRKPSDYSKKVTNALVRGICQFHGGDFTLVSGFAEGIDIVSHLSAVRNGAKTAAVLGCGIDYEYPQSNMKYRGVITQNGVFLSEYFPKTNPSKLNFPFRNRILSGLSLGAVVIEAGRKSGSLVTANLALGQGRDVFAVSPHDLFDLRYQGNAELLRDGALPVYGLEDILFEYYENYSHKITNAKVSDNVDLDGINDVQKRGGKPKTEPIPDKPLKAKPSIDLSSLNDGERAVAAVFAEKSAPLLPDEISVLCGMDITEVLSILTGLEIEGVIRPLAGGTYAI